MKPGITSWAQVKGRNSLGWVEKFKLDVWYVEHVSFLLDLKIILRDINAVYEKFNLLGYLDDDESKFNNSNNKVLVLLLKCYGLKK